MKIDQIAFYCSTTQAEKDVKEFFGLEDAEWIHDRVTAHSSFGESIQHFNSELAGIPPSVNIAELQFNYDLGIELEILKYTSGPSWHWTNPLNKGIPFISHVGIHIDNVNEFPSDSKFPIVQETFTTSHTSEYLTKEGSPGYRRKYHYRIYEMSPGSYIKYILRINPDG